MNDVLLFILMVSVLSLLLYWFWPGSLPGDKHD